MPQFADRRNVVVYIAGKFRAKDGKNQFEQFQNIRLAEEFALNCWREGFTVICPHANTMHFQGALPDDAFLVGDIELLERCDVVYAIDGWDKSRGATAEVDHARKKGITIVYTLAALLDRYPVSDHEPSIANE